MGRGVGEAGVCCYYLFVGESAVRACGRQSELLSNLYCTHTTQTLDFCRLVFLAPFSRAMRVADGACYVYAYALIWTDVQLW